MPPLAPGRALRRRSRRPPAPELVRTADWGYVRLREETYTKAQLERWIDRIRSPGWSEAYVFFKHEDAGAGPKLAHRFLELAGDNSMPCRRVPGATGYASAPQRTPTRLHIGAKARLSLPLPISPSCNITQRPTAMLPVAWGNALWPQAADHLAPLEWMIGEWTGETPGGSVMLSAK